MKRGVQLRPDTKIHILAYADDVVLLGDSPRNLQQKLVALENYTEVKGLRLNIEKTKIVVFNLSGRLITDFSYIYQNEALEIVKVFTYLGLDFVPSGKTNTAVEKLKAKANVATVAVWEILLNSKLRTWSSRSRILDALCLSIILYGSQLWGFEHYEDIERFHLSLYKKLFLIPQATPG